MIKEKSRWSHSRVSAYEGCPKAYKFRYVEKGNKQEFIGIQLIVGSVFHYVLEAMYKDFSLNGILPFKDIKNIFEVKWKEKLEEVSRRNQKIVINAEVKDLAPFKNFCFNCISRYYKKFYKSGVETDFDACKTEEQVLPEIFYDKDELIEFRGSIDRLDIKGDEVIIVDYKTSRHPPNDKFLDNSFKQLYLYGIAIQKQERFKSIKRIKVKLIYPYTGIIIDRVLTKESVEETKNHYIDLIKTLKKDKKFTQKPGFRCFSCGYRRICPELSATYRLEENKDDIAIKDAANLVDRYVLLKQKNNELTKEIDEIKDQILLNKEEFLDGSLEGAFVIPGAETGMDLVVDIEKVPKIPDSKDAMRDVMSKELSKKGLWEEIATLNSQTINPKIKRNEYTKEVMEVLSDYIYEDEESSRIRTRKRKKKPKTL